jgi:DNA polymerase III subunit gamma/tau
MSWYQQYRPRQVSGLHLTKVRTALQRFLEQGKLPQVFLFAGPKGTGKTSSARIIAALLNDPANVDQVRRCYFEKPTSTKNAHKPLLEPNLKDEAVLRIFGGNSWAVHEMDAASHRGIDDVRQLKEQSALPPQDGLMAVFILDEVHMLTTEAFNALLKLLEEPPPHAVFILATTELHKVPATIMSRCTVLEFTQASIPELVSALEGIVTAEKIKVEPGVLEEIAGRADGSFRDAVKLAEQVATQTGELTQTALETVLGSMPVGEVENLVNLVITKDVVAVTALFAAWRQAQIPQSVIHKQLMNYLHAALVAGVSGEVQTNSSPSLTPRVAIFLLQELLSLKLDIPSPISLLPLELKCLEIIFRSQDKQRSGEKPPAAGSGSSPASASSSAGAKLTPAKPGVKVSAMGETEQVVELPAFEEVTLSLPPQPEKADSVVASFVSPDDNIITPSEGDGVRLLELWNEFVSLVKGKNSSIGAILSSAQPVIGERGQAKIQLFYRFHQEQLQQPKFQQFLQESAESLTGGPVQFEFAIAQSQLVPNPVAESAVTPATAPASKTEVPPSTDLVAEDLSALATQILV